MLAKDDRSRSVAALNGCRDHPAEDRVVGERVGGRPRRQVRHPRALRHAPSGVCRVEGQRQAVHAVAVTGRRLRCVVEDMAEVRAAALAADLGALHAVRAVLDRARPRRSSSGRRTTASRSPTRTSCRCGTARCRRRGSGRCRCGARGAAVPVPGALGAGLAQHGVLLGRELRAPLLVGLLDSYLSCSRCFHVGPTTDTVRTWLPRLSKSRSKAATVKVTNPDRVYFPARRDEARPRQLLPVGRRRHRARAATTGRACCIAIPRASGARARRSTRSGCPRAHLTGSRRPRSPSPPAAPRTSYA